MLTIVFVDDASDLFQVVTYMYHLNIDNISQSFLSLVGKIAVISDLINYFGHSSSVNRINEECVDINTRLHV